MSDRVTVDNPVHRKGRPNGPHATDVQVTPTRAPSLDPHNSPTEAGPLTRTALTKGDQMRGASLPAPLPVSTKTPAKILATHTARIRYRLWLWGTVRTRR